MAQFFLNLFVQSIAQQLFAILVVFSVFYFHVNAQMEVAVACLPQWKQSSVFQL